MGSTSFLDPRTALFESGVQRLVHQSAILSRGTLTGCHPLLTLPMGATSSPDPATALSESGVPRLVLQSAVLSRGTLTRWNLLFTPPMGSTSPLDPPTVPLEPGMLRPILQLARLSGSLLTQSSLLHAPLTGITSFLGLMTTLPVYWTHSLPDFPLVTQRLLGKDGWVKDSEGGLLYWVPHEYRKRVHSPAVMTIPRTSRRGTVTLDFDDFAFGTSWSQIFKSATF